MRGGGPYSLSSSIGNVSDSIITNYRVESSNVHEYEPSDDIVNAMKYIIKSLKTARLNIERYYSSEARISFINTYIYTRTLCDSHKLSQKDIKKHVNAYKKIVEQENQTSEKIHFKNEFKTHHSPPK